MVTLGMGVKEGLAKGLPPAVMLRTMPFMLPEMLGITIPVAMLYAVSSVFGRMTGANEVVALKSLGISPMVMVWPVLVLASFLSLGTVWMYEIAATWCRPNVMRIACDSIEEIAYSMLRKNHSFSSSQFSITVKRVDDSKLILPTITIAGDGPTQGHGHRRRSRTAHRLEDAATDYHLLERRGGHRRARADHLSRQDGAIRAHRRAETAHLPPRLGRHERHPRQSRRSTDQRAASGTAPRGEEGPRRAARRSKTRKSPRTAT